MNRILTGLAALLLVVACTSGNPFDDEEDAGTDPGDPVTDPGPGDPIDSDRTLPPGSTDPAADKSIFRYEDRGEDGSGFARSPSYNATADTFTVDNLPFDGDNTYARGNKVGSLGPFAVYENAATVNDPQTGNPINQFTHKAIYALSPTGQTEMAIVRTGAYADYGFGGFVYQRNGGVTLPTAGQASYTGDYAGLRDFEGIGGLEYVRGDAAVKIDFEDFDNPAVDGLISNRVLFDQEGNDITGAFLTMLETQYGTNFTAMPNLRFVVADNVLDQNGEMVGTLNSRVNSDSGVQVFEEGNFYAVVAGENAQEVAGIIVVTAPHPTITGVEIRETGGFIVSR